MKQLDDDDKVAIERDLRGDTPQVGMLKIQVAATIAMITDQKYDDVITTMVIANNAIQIIAAGL